MRNPHESFYSESKFVYTLYAMHCIYTSTQRITYRFTRSQIIQTADTKSNFNWNKILSSIFAKHKWSMLKWCQSVWHSQMHRVHGGLAAVKWIIVHCLPLFDLSNFKRIIAQVWEKVSHYMTFMFHIPDKWGEGGEGRKRGFWVQKHLNWQKQANPPKSWVWIVISCCNCMQQISMPLASGIVT